MFLNRNIPYPQPQILAMAMAMVYKRNYVVKDSVLFCKLVMLNAKPIVLTKFERFFNEVQKNIVSICKHNSEPWKLLVQL